MARIDGVDPDQVAGPIEAVFRAQSQQWGAPLLNHLLYARRPMIFRGVRAMMSMTPYLHAYALSMMTMP